MDSPHRPTFVGRIPPHYWPVSGLKAIFFPLFCVYRFIGPTPLSIIDNIVDPDGL